MQQSCTVPKLSVLHGLLSMCWVSSLRVYSHCRHTVTERPLVGGYWLPSGCAVAYVYQLHRWQDQMRNMRAAGEDPFKATAVWPAAVATICYLAVLYLGKRIMLQRQLYDCRKFMLVYNLYQVRQRPGMTCTRVWEVLLEVPTVPAQTIITDHRARVKRSAMYGYCESAVRFFTFSSIARTEP
jgi:hypothetical protein